MYNTRSVNTRSVNPTVFGASGFYNADSSDAVKQAQKNIADATKNLADATAHLNAVQANYNDIKNRLAIAKKILDDCNRLRSAHRDNRGKDNACKIGDKQDVFNSLTRQMDEQAIALQSATAAVATSKQNLETAQSSAQNIKNADPVYAIQQQQIVAQQNIAQQQTNAAQQTAQAQIQATSVQEAEDRKSKLYIFGGLALLGVAALVIWLRKGKSGKVAEKVAMPGI